ncbi:MAG: hypothetical protein RL350_575 [Pseudomonadota bacterium]
MSARIYPPELGEIAPNYWVDPRFTYKNLERIFEEDRICGLFKNASDREGISVNVLGVEPTGLRFKVMPLADGSHPAIIGNRILVTYVDSGKVQFSLNNIPKNCNCPTTQKL